LKSHLSPDGVGIFGAMFDIYRSLLEQIRRRDGDVFSSRVTLGACRKTFLAARRLAPRLLRVGDGDSSVDPRAGS
jgi:hypothetical protein